MSEEQVENTLPEGIAVGRIVHFHATISAGGVFERPLPAIIVRVWNGGLVDLEIFGDEGMSRRHRTSIEYDAKASRGGTWRFPPRVSERTQRGG